VTDDQDRELDVDGLRANLARRLGVSAHALELRTTGADFHVFVLGDLGIRAPRRPRMLGKLAAERAVLDAIASSFGMRVPVPGARTPAGAEPLSPMFAYRWLKGTPIGSATPSAALVDDLARFLQTLHAIEGAPAVRDATPGTVVQRLQAVARARHIDAWSNEAVPAGDVTPCLIHGDLSATNILVDASGRLAGVVDWSDSAITDPAIDFGAIAQWAGLDVLDQLLVHTGRASDPALRTRAEMVSYFLSSFS